MTTSSPYPSALSTQPKRLQQTLVYFASYVVLGLILSVVGPTLPGLAGQTESTLGQISVIFAGNSLGIVVGSLLGGWLFDRHRGHPILIAALIFLSILLFALPWLPSRWLLLFVFVLIGVSIGILDVGGNTLIVWLFDHAVGPYMNALHLSFGLGALLSPMLADRIVMASGGIHWVYWSLAILVLPVIFWLTRIPSPARLDASPEGHDTTSHQHNPLLILMISALFFMHVGTELGFGSWIFSYAVATGIGPDTLARLLNTLYWGGFTLGRLISVPLSIRLRPQTMLLVDLLGAATSIGTALILHAWPPAIWIAAFGLGLSIASMVPSTINFAERRMPISGRVTSYFLVGGNIGSMLLPWLIGQMFETSGPQSMLIILEIAMLLALLLFLGINWYTHNQAPQNSTA